ncbi:hypothetical protein KCP75_05065 [Salmonella enterica subsp. enterica]|nr:hypothetical protein KCP75_05065 [Salmonella enterica subsp. enterica]
MQQTRAYRQRQRASDGSPHHPSRPRITPCRTPRTRRGTGCRPGVYPESSSRVYGDNRHHGRYAVPGKLLLQIRAADGENGPHPGRGHQDERRADGTGTNTTPAPSGTLRAHTARRKRRRRDGMRHDPLGRRGRVSDMEAGAQFCGVYGAGEKGGSDMVRWRGQADDHPDGAEPDTDGVRSKPRWCARNRRG